VEVINEDYGDYVSLSSRLVNVDGSVIRMRRPLLDLKVGHWARACSRRGSAPIAREHLGQGAQASLACRVDHRRLQAA
jgi:hypothetical protein